MKFQSGFEPFGDAPVLPDYAVRDLYAVRQFRVLRGRDGSHHLVGISYPQEVVSGINVAQCGNAFRSGHPTGAPAADCTCGFYVYDTDKAWEEGDEYVRVVVRVSGRVVVCEWGLRVAEIELVALSLERQYDSYPDEAVEIERDLKSTLPGVTFYKSDYEMLKAHPVVEVDRQSGRVREDPAGARKTRQNMTSFPAPTINYNRALFIFCLAIMSPSVVQYLGSASERVQIAYSTLVCIFLTYLSSKFTVERFRVREWVWLLIDASSRILLAFLVLSLHFYLAQVINPPEPVDYLAPLMRPSSEALDSIPPMVAAPHPDPGDQLSKLYEQALWRVVFLFSCLVSMANALLSMMLILFLPFFKAPKRLVLDSYDRLDLIPAVTRSNIQLDSSTKGQSHE